jgi:hypothetical protein
MGYNTTVREVRQPTPEEMAVALREAAHEGHWNHWEHDFLKHASDWADRASLGRPLSQAEFEELPGIVASYPACELCTYLYRRRRVWGYQARYLPFLGQKLPSVVVVYDPRSREIVHCMRARGYFADYRRRRSSDFVEVTEWK